MLCITICFMLGVVRYLIIYIQLYCGIAPSVVTLFFKIRNIFFNIVDTAYFDCVGSFFHNNNWLITLAMEGYE